MYMKYFIEESEPLLYLILHRESIILEGSGLQLPKKKTQGRKALKSGVG